ncbi:hypothetical protein Tco_0909891 [Tanacetum coccineum]|uniref:Uncharacterized protein n=1 Tax=Tanacetum coccineum TaxID=301880 RepID=A0ABQ5CRA4_9ASTR
MSLFLFVKSRVDSRYEMFWNFLGIYSCRMKDQEDEVFGRILSENKRNIEYPRALHYGSIAQDIRTTTKFPTGSVVTTGSVIVPAGSVVTTGSVIVPAGSVVTTGSVIVPAGSVVTTGSVIVPAGSVVTSAEFSY